MTLNQTTKPVEMDVCDFLNRNPGIKEVVGQILGVYGEVSILPFPKDVRHAAYIVAFEADALMESANTIYCGVDSIDERENLLDRAVRTGAMTIRLLENIGNLKAGE
jgi:hypothetical protein